MHHPVGIGRLKDLHAGTVLLPTFIVLYFIMRSRHQVGIQRFQKLFIVTSALYDAWADPIDRHAKLCLFPRILVSCRR